MKYYIQEDNNQYGPFTIEQLQQRGITRDTLMWCEGMSHWTTAKNIPELINIIQPNQTNNSYSPHGYPLAPPDRPYPEEHKALAIVATIITFLGCYFLPFGIIPLIYSFSIEGKWKRGDYEGAERYAKRAKTWGIWTLLLPFIFWGLLFIMAFSASLINQL